MFSVQKIHAALPGYFCKTQGTILSMDEYFSKPDCFNLTKLRVLTQENNISEFSVITRYHDSCSQAYINWWWIVNDISKLPQFIADYKAYWKSYYFKIAQDTLWSVTVNTGWINPIYFWKIPIDSPWEVFINSIMTWYFSEEPQEFKKLPNCPPYKHITTIKNPYFPSFQKTYLWEWEILVYLIALVFLWIGISLWRYFKKTKKEAS